MKRFIKLLFVLTLLFWSGAMSARTFVLCTGVSDYADPQINDLTRPGKDAVLFGKLMKTQTQDVTVLTSKHATAENIISSLRYICSVAKAEDRIIFFFSGHGGPDMIVAHDATIAYSTLDSVLKTAKSKTVMCFIDACFAGTAASNVRSNYVFFVSSRPDEVSQEEPHWVGAGFLSQALMKGMRGKADYNGDRKVTVIELFRYIYKDVTTRSSEEQHPQLIASKSMYDTVVVQW